MYVPLHLASFGPEHVSEILLHCDVHVVHFLFIACECCLENPRDGGAWWAAVYGVAQSRTRLNDLAAAAVFPRMGTLQFVYLLPCG